MAVYNRNGILYVHFSCFLPDKCKVYCRESTGLKDTVQNRKIASAKDKAIKYELKHGRFQYLHFFPDGAKAKLFRDSSPDITLTEYWDIWLKEKSLRATTEKSWRSAWEQHIKPYFGNYPISAINEGELLKFRKTLEAKELAPSSINDKIMKVICMCLFHAKRRGRIAYYPCESIKRLTEQPVDIEPMSFSELNHFIDTLEKKKKFMYADMFIFWSRTGLRPGELCALKWKHIDYHNRKALIRHTRYAGKDEPVKTVNSNRDVDLSDAAIAALTRQEKRTGLQNKHVWRTEAGVPYSEDYLRKVFRHLLRLAGLRYRAVKQMRHTFASLALGSGEQISWVSRMLGHSSPDITWRRYNRYIPNLTRLDGSALESAFSKISHCDKN